MRSSPGAFAEESQGSNSRKEDRDGDGDGDGDELWTEDLVRTVLVGTHRTGRAVDMIRRSKNIFIFHGPDGHREAGRGAAEGMQDAVSSSSTSTVNDVLWPLVVAVQSGARIFLSQPNTHLQNLDFGSQIPSETWTSLGASRTMSSGIVRLHGFGVRTSRVDVVRMSSSGRGIVVPGDGCPLSDISTADGHTSNPLPSSSEPSTSSPSLENSIPTESPGSASPMAPLPLLLRVTFSDFLVGRDGSCCVVYKGVTLTCLIRPVKFLLIKLAGPFGDSKLSSPSSSASSPAPSTDNANFSDQPIHTPPSAVSHSQPPLAMELSLRGNMFADEIFNLPLLLPICLAACGDHARDYGDATSIPSDVFELTLQL